MCHSTRTTIKSRGIITSLNRPALGKEPSFRLLSDRFGIALHPSAQTYSLAMLGSMEPDPIAGFMHVANIVIIPGGLRKCRALEWLQIISRNNWDRLVIPTVIYEWWLTVCAIWGLLYIRIYDYIFLADQHVVCLYLAHSLGENQTLYGSLWELLFVRHSELLVKRSVLLQVAYCGVNHLGLMACWKWDQRIETERSLDCKPYYGRWEEGWKDRREEKAQEKKKKDRAKKRL